MLKLFNKYKILKRLINLNNKHKNKLFNNCYYKWKDFENTIITIKNIKNNQSNLGIFDVFNIVLRINITSNL